ncbi:MAG: DUF2207 domain-containing protein [Anaerolineae bacterium]
MKRGLLWVIVGALAMVLVTRPIQAQTRSVFWNLWNVIIDQMDTTNNRFRVTENYDISFTGAFSYGTAYIPTSRLDHIENVTVTQNGTPLRATCNRQPGTYCVTYEDDQLNLVYYFLSPINSTREKIQIAYDVHGALRVYEGGDQLWWAAVPTEHYGFPIGAATVKVVLPEDSAPREGIDPVVTYGAPTAVNVDGSVVTATATRPLSGDEGLEIRVQYPHDPDAIPPAWQASFDTEQSYKDSVLPLINLAILAASALVGIGGTLFIFIRLQTRGRDPQIGPVPTHLSEPPDDTPPAVVGSLVDETVDLRDIISTLVDLARRGYLVFEEGQSDGMFGFGTSRTFTFKRTDKSLQDVAPFEAQLMREVFPHGTLERTMNSMRNTFYKSIPRLQRDVYTELVQRGFFPRSPESVRASWRGMGTLLAGIGVFAGFALYFFVKADFLWLSLPFAISFVGVVAMLVASWMPAKTAKGAEAAAKWRAFEKYLSDLQSFSDESTAVERFDQYLPYAVAFGMERSFLRKFEDVPVQIPVWYFPTYRGGYWSGGYRPGTPLPTSGIPGGLARAGGGGLDDLSGGLSGGLQSMSDGLTSMLNSASSVMNSRPANTGSSGSWGGGGGGFSGGGFGGGGFSGGGGRGFG